MPYFQTNFFYQNQIKENICSKIENSHKFLSIEIPKTFRFFCSYVRFLDSCVAYTVNAYNSIANETHF